MGEVRKTVSYKVYDSFFLLQVRIFLIPFSLASRCCPLTEEMDQGYHVHCESYCILPLCLQAKILPENVTYFPLLWIFLFTSEWLSPPLHDYGESSDTGNRSCIKKPFFMVLFWVVNMSFLWPWVCYCSQESSKFEELGFWGAVDSYLHCCWAATFVSVTSVRAWHWWVYFGI